MDMEENTAISPIGMEETTRMRNSVRRGLADLDAEGVSEFADSLMRVSLELSWLADAEFARAASGGDGDRIAGRRLDQSARHAEIASNLLSGGAGSSDRLRIAAEYAGTALATLKWARETGRRTCAEEGREDDGTASGFAWKCMIAMYLVLWTGIAAFMFSVAPIVGVSYLVTLVVGVGIAEVFLPDWSLGLFRIIRRKVTWR